MREYVNANETLRDNDRDTVMAAIRLAVEEGCRKVVIPRYNARTKEMKWSFLKAVELPSRFTLILDNCFLEQAPGSYDHLITNERSHDDDYMNDPANEARDIAVLGEGNVILSGGEHNHLLEKTARKYGLPSMWHQPVLFWRNVNGLRVENLHVRNQRWWAITHIMTRNAVLKNIDFYAIPHVPNLDGIDLRIGCSHFHIENITGRTGDDLVAFTALKGKGEVTMMVPGRDTGIHDVTVKNLKGDSNTCYPLRLLNHDGNEICQIDVDTIMDSSDPTSRVRSGAALSIGSPFYYSVSQAVMGDTRDIHVKNVYSRGNQAVILNHVLKDTAISNVHTFSDNLNGVFTMPDGCELQNVSVDHLYCGSEQPRNDDGTRITKEEFVGVAVDMQKMKGTLRVSHLETGEIGTGILVRGGGTVIAEDAVFGSVRAEAVRDEASEVWLNGEKR